jgi:hypothetical protein
MKLCERKLRSGRWIAFVELTGREARELLVGFEPRGQSAINQSVTEEYMKQLFASLVAELGDEELMEPMQAKNLVRIVARKKRLRVAFDALQRPDSVAR